MNQIIINYTESLGIQYLKEYYEIEDEYLPIKIKCDEKYLINNIIRLYLRLINYICNLIAYNKNLKLIEEGKLSYMSINITSPYNIKPEVNIHFTNYFPLLEKIMETTIDNFENLGFYDSRDNSIRTVFYRNIPDLDIKYNKLILKKYFCLHIENYKLIKSLTLITPFARSLLCLYTFDFDYSKITPEIEKEIEQYFS
jgi:hypothetical protein